MELLLGNGGIETHRVRVEREYPLVVSHLTGSNGTFLRLVTPQEGWTSGSLVGVCPTPQKENLNTWKESTTMLLLLLPLKTDLLHLIKLNRVSHWRCWDTLFLTVDPILVFPPLTKVSCHLSPMHWLHYMQKLLMTENSGLEMDSWKQCPVLSCCWVDRMIG